jgi:hypothetical protein
MEANKRLEQILTSVTWMPFNDGRFGKSRHGHYFVYRNFDPETRSNRWFANYEAGSDRSGEEGNLINLHGFDSLEDAQSSCEKHAQGTDSALQGNRLCTLVYAI